MEDLPHELLQGLQCGQKFRVSLQGTAPGSVVQQCLGGELREQSRHAVHFCAAGCVCGGVGER